MTILLPENGHSCYLPWDLSTIESPRCFQRVQSKPVEVVVQLKDEAKPKTFKAWLNRKNITDKFVYDETENEMIATIGTKDGLRVKEDARGSLNILKTKIMGKRGN